MRLFSLLLSGLLPLSLLADDSSLGPDLELVCPCTIESASSGSVIGNFGVINRGSSASGELIVRAYAHTEQNYRDAADPVFLTDFYLTSSLAATSEEGASEHQARLFPIDGGDYYVTYLLLEDFFIVDETRTSGTVTIGSNLAATSSGTGLYFVGDPSITINGSTLTLNWPGLGNSDVATANVEVKVIATETERFVSQPPCPWLL